MRGQWRHVLVDDHVDRLDDRARPTSRRTCQRSAYEADDAARSQRLDRALPLRALGGRGHGRLAGFSAAATASRRRARCRRSPPPSPRRCTSSSPWLRQQGVRKPASSMDASSRAILRSARRLGLPMAESTLRVSAASRGSPSSSPRSPPAAPRNTVLGVPRARRPPCPTGCRGSECPCADRES